LSCKESAHLLIALEAVVRVPQRRARAGKTLTLANAGKPADASGLSLSVVQAGAFNELGTRQQSFLSWRLFERKQPSSCIICHYYT
jgi:hypothetical protein